MFDTHTHLNFKRFKKNVAEVIDRAHAARVTHMVVPGTDVKTSREAVRIAQENDHIYAAVGIHPHHVAKYLKNSLKTSPLSRQVGRDPLPEGGPATRSPLQREYPKGEGCSEEIKKYISDDLYEIESLLSHPKVVAIGEVGMDRHVYENTKYAQYAVDERFLETQRALFRKHMRLAIQYGKSIILHNREAANELVSILSDAWDPKLEGRSVLHCCEADERLLSIAKDHHMFIGVDGDVTYDKVKQDFIRSVPIEMLVLETDSPYILPEPLLSQKKYPNEPANLSYIAQSVAKIKGLTVEEVDRITTENGKRLFNIV
ncbi:MAG: TatD family hydrolase [bacterium]|nr:TatD family hydrolase [bacterium]